MQPIVRPMHWIAVLPVKVIDADTDLIVSCQHDCGDLSKCWGKQKSRCTFKLNETDPLGIFFNDTALKPEL